MYSYKRIIVYIFLIFFIIGCTEIRQPKHSNLIKHTYKYKTFAHEDRYIMYALEYDRKGKREESRALYLKLFLETFKEEYLLEYSMVSFSIKKYDDIIREIPKNRKQIIKYENKISRVYILSLIQKKNYDEALSEINSLLKKYKSDLNYELLGNIYLHKKEYKKAKELYTKVYSNSLTPNSLINLVNIMYAYLDEKKEAINYLESHIKVYGCKDLVCTKLLSFYQEQKNIDGVISVLKKMYYMSLENNHTFSFDKIYKLLMYYLEKQDIKEAIKFLVESNADDDKLFSLYRNDNQKNKALTLVNKLYSKKGNIDYLAQIAMLEFEIAKDKRKVVKSVIKKFEDVLSVLDNHVYQNYLGYILIDLDIDVKKGLEYVNKALEKAPSNLAYIDSLAWGQYKLKECDKAQENMQKVVDSAGLNDKEIKIHWNKIKECHK